MDFNILCMKGIAATNAVDKLTDKYPGRCEGFDHESWLIEVGIEFEAEMKRQEEALTKMSDVVGVG